MRYEKDRSQAAKSRKWKRVCLTAVVKRHVEQLDARELRRRAIELRQLRRLRRREQRRPLIRNGRFGRGKGFFRGGERRGRVGDAGVGGVDRRLGLGQGRVQAVLLLLVDQHGLALLLALLGLGSVLVLRLEGVHRRLGLGQAGAVLLVLRVHLALRRDDNPLRLLDGGAGLGHVRLGVVRAVQRDVVRRELLFTNMSD